MMLSGCGSNMRTNTYRCRASYAARNVVRNVGVVSIRGANWRKSEMGVAVRQIGSSSRPSITGACVARVAIAIAVSVWGVGCCGVLGVCSANAAAQRSKDGVSMRDPGNCRDVGQRLAGFGWQNFCLGSSVSDPHTPPPMRRSFVLLLSTALLGAGVHMIQQDAAHYLDQFVDRSV